MVGMLIVPNKMLNKFDMLRGTLNATMPAMEIGILFKEPTKLWNGNQISGTSNIIHKPI